MELIFQTLHVKNAQQIHIKVQIKLLYGLAILALILAKFIIILRGNVNANHLIGKKLLILVHLEKI
jgi:hypothetical protein